MIHTIEQMSRASWPIEAYQRLQTVSTTTRHRQVVPFSFESLECLWDASPARSASDRWSHSMPRAIYELDCRDWIRAPLSSDGRSRGILALCCLVDDPSVHVHCDRDRACHIHEFTERVRGELPRDLVTEDAAVLADWRVVQAIARTAGASLLVDDGSRARLCLLQAEPPPQSCAWLVRDGTTATWSARVFGDASLVASLRTVRRLAFLGAIKGGAIAWEETSCSVTDMVVACRRAGIAIPARLDRDRLVRHVKAIIEDPVSHSTRE